MNTFPISLRGTTPYVGVGWVGSGRKKCRLGMGNPYREILEVQRMIGLRLKWTDFFFLFFSFCMLGLCRGLFVDACIFILINLLLSLFLQEPMEQS
jgi:hypothetical protein